MSTKVSSPSVPEAPSAADAVNAWVENLPKIYETQMQYAPQELAQQLELYQQYAPQLSQAAYDISSQLYPETVALQEKLAKQASEGISSGMPSAYRDQYSDYYKSLLGENVKSGIGADYYSTNMLQQEKNWQDYYRNLGLSMTGRQPLQQPQMGGYTNYMSGYTPLGVGQQQQSGYSSYSNLYGNMYNTNAQMAQANSPISWLGGLGMGAMGLGSMAEGFGWG